MAEKLNIGEQAPAFEGHDAEGRIISSKSLSGHPYVLYFYPKDDTLGCTTQACSLRDRKVDIDSYQAALIGVSPDNAQSHQKFISKYILNFTLLTDENHKICESFGVWQEKMSYGKKSMGVIRTTFIIDGKGFIRWMESPVKVEGHAERVLEALKKIS